MSGFGDITLDNINVTGNLELGFAGAAIPSLGDVLLFDGTYWIPGVGPTGPTGPQSETVTKTTMPACIDPTITTLFLYADECVTV